MAPSSCKRVEVVFVVLEYLTIERLGPFETAGAMMRESFFQKGVRRHAG